MNALERAIEIAGGQSALAKKLGKLPSHLQYWRFKGFPPAEIVAAIVEATGGKVSKSDLRPDLWPKRNGKRAA